MPSLPQRVSHRLNGYDYSQANGYFITIVTHRREALFGTLEAEQVMLNDCGLVVQDCWNRLTRSFPVLLEESIVMPDHFHGILFLRGEAASEKWIPSGPRGTKPASLGAVIQAFKTTSATRINRLRRAPGQAVWQRNYYDHILRCEEDYQNAVRYIVENPIRHSLNLETE